MNAARPAMARQPATQRQPRGALDGGILSVRAWLLLAAGPAGGLLFTGAYLAEGATRAGYQTPEQPISSLSLGPGGWVQQLNFVVFGVLVCLSAAGWRAALTPGRGALAFPALRVIAGLGLVMDGLFAQDPSGGYPPGGSTRPATLHGQVHAVFALITITALAGGCFVLAARFASEPGWRRWAAFALAAGVATIAFIAAFGATDGHGGLAGLWERAAGGATTVLTVAVLARLAVANRRAATASLPGHPAGAA
jgi:hypothetical protein